MNRDEAARQITEAVTQLFFSAENQGRFHGAAEELGISPPMLKALLELAPDDTVQMRDLADRWACDASFVTVTCDGLEARGLIERRVAEHDRRLKLVGLTPSGAEAHAWAIGEVYGRRAGLDALTDDEQVTLAALLTRLAAAQATHDEKLLEEPGARAAARRMAAQRTREHRGRGAEPGSGPDAGGWREHLATHREEIRRLKEEVARVSAEVRMHVQRPVDEARSTSAEVKAEAKAIKADVKAEAKAIKSDVKAEAKAVRDELRNQPRGGRRPR